MKLVHQSPNGTFKVQRLSNTVYVCIENDGKYESVRCCYVGLNRMEYKNKLIGLMANNNIGFTDVEVRSPVKRISDRFKWEAKIKGISYKDVVKLGELNRNYDKVNYPEIYSKMSHLWE